AACRVEDVSGSAVVDGGKGRVATLANDRDQMHDGVGALDRPDDVALIANVAPDDLSAPIAQRPCRDCTRIADQAANLLAGRKQLSYDVVADKAGATGD